jgi:aldehyde dehydrogenase (NAD+)
MIEDFAFSDESCFIDGKWVIGDGPPIRSVNPTTAETLASTPSSSQSQVAAATLSAARAFHGGEWSRVSARDRSDMLSRLADLIERDQDRLIELIALEVGTPITSGRDLQIVAPIMFFRWFAEAAKRGPKAGLSQSLPLHYGSAVSQSVLLREPAGVVAAITAYNYPLNLCSWKLGPALASGCSVILVPSPKALLCTIALVRLIEEAGFPPGAVNFVFGSPSVTQQVAGAPEVDLVSFTGSAAVGAKIMALAAPSLKRVVLELGGKSPSLLMPGANVKEVAGPTVLRFCRNAGQGCGATTRLLVPQNVMDEFVDETVTFMRGLSVGDPLFKETDVGPLITDEHRVDVEGFIGRAIDQGATLVTGGHRPEALEPGFFFEPTLVTGLSADAEINQEELFAPVASVIPYRDLDEAVEIANNSRYGLNANIWGPTAEAIALARRIRSGTVTINGGGKRDDAPWGGFGASGVGRECGEEGLREFFEVKHVQWPL